MVNNGYLVVDMVAKNAKYLFGVVNHRIETSFDLVEEVCVHVYEHLEISDVVVEKNGVFNVLPNTHSLPKLTQIGFRNKRNDPQP